MVSGLTRTHRSFGFRTIPVFFCRSSHSPALLACEFLLSQDIPNTSIFWLYTPALTRKKTLKIKASLETGCFWKKTSCCSFGFSPWKIKVWWISLSSLVHDAPSRTMQTLAAMPTKTINKNNELIRAKYGFSPGSVWVWKTPGFGTNPRFLCQKSWVSTHKVWVQYGFSMGLSWPLSFCTRILPPLNFVLQEAIRADYIYLFPSSWCSPFALNCGVQTKIECFFYRNPRF